MEPEFGSNIVNESNLGAYGNVSYLSMKTAYLLAIASGRGGGGRR